MKKSKLITNLCLIVLTIACLTFGVYSAVKTKFTASGTITFNAYGVDCLLDVTISGIQAASDTTTNSTTHLSSKTLKLSTFTKTGVTDGYTKIDTTVNMGKLVFDELNANLTDEQRKTITISIALKNYSGFAVQLTGTVGTSLPTNLAVTLSDFISAEKSSDGTTAATAIGNYTITLKAKGAIAEQSVNFANLTIKPYTDPYQKFLDQGYVLETAENFECQNGAISWYKGGNTKIILPKIEGVNAIMGHDETSPLAASGVSQTLTNSMDLINTVKISTYAGGICNGISGVITHIVVPESYVTIGKKSFSLCENLKSIYISNTVKNIGDFAFQECYRLTTINFSGTKAQWNAITFGSSWNTNTGAYTIHCTDGDIAKA